MANDGRAQALAQATEPEWSQADLEEQMGESKKRLRNAADYLAGVSARIAGSRYRWDAPDPELLAASLETLASLATGMAAEARTGKVAW